MRDHDNGIMVGSVLPVVVVFPGGLWVFQSYDDGGRGEEREEGQNRVDDATTEGQKVQSRGYLMLLGMNQ
jgi:hypothetical protein